MLLGASDARACGFCEAGLVNEPAFFIFYTFSWKSHDDYKALSISVGTGAHACTFWSLQDYSPTDANDRIRVGQRFRDSLATAFGGEARARVLSRRACALCGLSSERPNGRIDIFIHSTHLRTRKFAKLFPSDRHPHCCGTYECKNFLISVNKFYFDYI